MFNGSKETQQAASQKLLEAVVHLRRASDALLAVQPLCDNSDIPFSRDTLKFDRGSLEKLAHRYEAAYDTAAREAFA